MNEQFTRQFMRQFARQFTRQFTRHMIKFPRQIRDTIHGHFHDNPQSAHTPMHSYTRHRPSHHHTLNTLAVACNLGTSEHATALFGLVATLNTLSTLNTVDLSGNLYTRTLVQHGAQNAVATSRSLSRWSTLNHDTIEHIAPFTAFEHARH